MAREKKPREAFEVLASQDDAVASMVRRSQELDQLNSLIKQSLPAPLAAQVFVANVRDRVLVVLTPSPTFSSRIRLAAPGIIQVAVRHGIDVAAVRVKVSQHLVLPRVEGERPAIRLSPQTHKMLVALAKETSDKTLKRALRALAFVGRSKGGRKPKS